MKFNGVKFPLPAQKFKEFLSEARPEGGQLIS
jgi:hypothetical protein